MPLNISVALPIFQKLTSSEHHQCCRLLFFINLVLLPYVIDVLAFILPAPNWGLFYFQLLLSGKGTVYDPKSCLLNNKTLNMFHLLYSRPTNTSNPRICEAFIDK